MDSKKKCRQYSADYIKYGFVKSPCNEQLPMCLLCDQVFSNEGMKPSRIIVHLKSRHGDKSDNDVDILQKLARQSQNAGRNVWKSGQTKHRWLGCVIQHFAINSKNWIATYYW